MHKKRVPTGLRWFFFVLGIGTLTSAGIYLKAYIAGGTILDEGLSALMFFLLGLFFTRTTKDAPPCRRGGIRGFQMDSMSI